MHINKSDMENFNPHTSYLKFRTDLSDDEFSQIIDDSVGYSIEMLLAKEKGIIKLVSNDVYGRSDDESIEYVESESYYYPLKVFECIITEEDNPEYFL